MEISKAYQAFYTKDYDGCIKQIKEISNDTIPKLDLLAQAYFKKKKYQDAYDTYQRLFGILKNKDDGYNVQRRENILLIVCCAQIENPGSLKINQKDVLPKVEDIIACVDELKTEDNTCTDLFTDKENTKKKRKTQRKRKKRLPKTYDPVAGPNPERWLPRRDRTKAGGGGKGKKRDKAKNQPMRGIQGALPAAAAATPVSTVNSQPEPVKAPPNRKMARGKKGPRKL